MRVRVGVFVSCCLVTVIPGNVSILARVDDVMNVAGHRLTTAQIEEAIMHHPAVSECAVLAKSALVSVCFSLVVVGFLHICNISRLIRATLIVPHRG